MIWFGILVGDLLCPNNEHIQYDFISAEHVLQQPQMQLLLFFYSKIEDCDLNVLQYLFCGIATYSSAIFRKHFDILDFLCWKLELEFVFLQCLKQGQLLWKKPDAKTNGNGIVPLLTEYIMYVQYAVSCKCVWKRLGLIPEVHFPLHLSRMLMSSLFPSGIISVSLSRLREELGN